LKPVELLEVERWALAVEDVLLAAVVILVDGGAGDVSASGR